jgi:hypothetical protein
MCRRFVRLLHGIADGTDEEPLQRRCGEAQGFKYRGDDDARIAPGAAEPLAGGQSLEGPDRAAEWPACVRMLRVTSMLRSRR